MTDATEEDETARAYRELIQQLARPPQGWFTFGTHVDDPDARLEWWGDDGSGLPLWERPVPRMPDVVAHSGQIVEVSNGDYDGTTRVTVDVGETDALTEGLHVFIVRQRS